MCCMRLLLVLASILCGWKGFDFPSLFWDVPADVLAAPASALYGWKGVLQSLSLPLLWVRYVQWLQLIDFMLFSTLLHRWCEQLNTCWHSLCPFEVHDTLFCWPHAWFFTIMVTLWFSADRSIMHRDPLYDGVYILHCAVITWPCTTLCTLCTLCIRVRNLGASVSTHSGR